MRKNVKARSKRMPMTTVVTIPAIVPGRSDDDVVWSLVVAVRWDVDDVLFGVVVEQALGDGELGTLVVNDQGPGI